LYQSVSGVTQWQGKDIKAGRKQMRKPGGVHLQQAVRTKQQQAELGEEAGSERGSAPAAY
jgi:hypothetical protein